MSQKLTTDQVAHVAHLARLELTDEELTTYSEQLSAILAYVEQLESVDTTAVEPVAQVTGLSNVLQDDAEAADSVDRDKFLAGAPAAQPPYIKVKAVLE